MCPRSEGSPFGSGQAELGDRANLFDAFVPKPLSKSALAAAMTSVGLPGPS